MALLAYAELRAMDVLARGAGLAPDAAGRITVLDLAGRRHDHHRALRAELGEDAVTAMAAVAAPVDEFHAHTEPRSWPEVLVSLHAGDGLASDFYREVTVVLGEGVLGEGFLGEGFSAGPAASADFAADRILALVTDEPRLAGRLTLWARRVVGEAMTQAQRLVGDDPALAGLLTGTEAGPDLAAASNLFARLLSQHNRRMAELGMTV